MEIDSPAPEPISPQARIMERLARIGVPQDYVDRRQFGLVTYLKDNQVDMTELISALFPTEEDVGECLSDIESGAADDSRGPTLEELFQESMVWVQWLMFKGDPGTALERLSQLNVGERGVCGAVWGNNDIAYRCRTCEHDPTCAICVPCFQNGDHKGHDYSIIYTGSGCCDCGDITAWKHNGFCLKHKGTQQIQPLPSEFANSMAPILDSLFCFWKNRLASLQSVSEQSPAHDHISQEIREKLTSAVVELLLKFCGHSESLLSFISGKMFSLHGLMEILIRVEQFFCSDVVRTLHELLLKLLSEPQFKYEFAKVFLDYYPTVVDEAIKESSDDIFKKYPLLNSFSVQIFTVPTLTPRLVKEVNLLPMLLECLEKIFISCAGDDGRLKIVEWGVLYETTLRVVEDIRFVMSHFAVPIYVTHERHDIARTWMRILSFVQGMNPQKRETSMHIEEENDNMHLPFVLGHSLANIHSYIVEGAFSDVSSEEVDRNSGSSIFRKELEDPDTLRHAKIGRISQECSVNSLIGRSSKVAETMFSSASIPYSVLWLTFECLRTIDGWLVLDNPSSRIGSLSSRLGSMSGNTSAFTKTLSKTLFGSSGGSGGSKITSTSDVLSRQSSISSRHGIFSLDSGLYVGQEASSGSEIFIQTECSPELESLKVLSLAEWPNIVYDVSSLNISSHIPLHRLLSMLLQRSLRKCYGESALNVLAPTSEGPSPDFFSHILRGCSPCGFSALLMEHPLRIRVFCAQVRAGMWRRNGDAAILSCEWYHSGRWSEQGLELDLFLLQCCATLAPPDQYVKRILERYGLSKYLKLNLERSSEYESTLVQEMLSLIIQIVKERRFCGLTAAECLRKELIYKLSVGDATHSQLVKSLPRDLSKNGDLQQIMDSVAVYSNPSGLNQGMYKLRLECWKELDLYHPRCNSRDLQIAEERYLRFCNISAVAAQLPSWSKIYQPLSGLSQIATCKTILQILRTVLFYAVFSDKPKTSRAPEGVLLTAMHLLSLALDICSLQRASGQSVHGEVTPILEFASEEISSTKHADQSLLSLLVILMRLHEKEKIESFAEAVHSNISSLCGNILKKFAELEPKCFIKLQKIAPEVVNQVSECYSNLEDSMIGLASDSEKRKAKARERQAAVMAKMKAQQSKFLDSIESTSGQEAAVSECGEDLVDNEGLHNSKDSEEVICSLCHDSNSESPVCFLIHLQKSRLLSFLDKGPVSWKHSSQSKVDHFSLGKSAISTPLLVSDVSDSSHLELEHLVQSAVDSFASNSQPHEINEFLEFIKTHFPSVRNIDYPLISEDSLIKTSSIEKLEEHMYSFVQENVHSRFLQKDFQKHGDDFSAAGGTQEGSSQSLLIGKYMASIAKEITNNPSGSENLLSCHNRVQSSNSVLTHTYDGFSPSDCDGIYLSSCGHAVHQGCLERYLSSLKDRYVRRITFEGGHIVDPEKGEFLCPVCRGLANSVLPTLPRDSEVAPPPVFPNLTASYPGRFSASSSTEVVSLRIREATALMESAAFVAGNKESLKSLSLLQFERQKPNLDSLYRALCSMYFPSKGKIIESGRVSHSLLLWDMLKYSVASTEIAARSGKQFLTPTSGSDSLLNELKSSSGFILSLLLNIVQGTKSKDVPAAFLRFRGIQLFVGSLCLGSSNVEQNHQEGTMLSLLEKSYLEAKCPDIQFWKRASDPVLAHDAFSSLMWALFCLPTSFLSCKDSFLCLVHIFYLVAVTQAIVTWFRKRKCSLIELCTELGVKDCLITDICKVIKDNEIPLQYFDSNYIDSSCNDIKDAIRSLSSPFLRRCSLLWGLVNSSASFPFSHVSYGSAYIPPDTSQSNIVDIAEVERLQLMFNIPPIDVFMNDDMSRAMVTRWLNHFSTEFRFEGQNVLYCTPSVPFSLMILPNLYEDLLQRYIKQPCPDCGAVLDDPVLCLLCGKLCSPNWKTCCRESGCRTHAVACGAGTGVFLLIRRTSILLQRAARQAPWPSPYLDAFGEEDCDVARGRPLYLNEERYAALTHMVASHGLDRSSRVLHQTTMGSFFILN